MHVNVLATRPMGMACSCIEPYVIRSSRIDVQEQTTLETKWFVCLFHRRV